MLNKKYKEKLSFLEDLAKGMLSGDIVASYLDLIVLLNRMEYIAVTNTMHKIRGGK